MHIWIMNNYSITHGITTERFYMIKMKSYSINVYHAVSKHYYISKLVSIFPSSYIDQYSDTGKKVTLTLLLKITQEFLDYF